MPRDELEEAKQIKIFKLILVLCLRSLSLSKNKRFIYELLIIAIYQCYYMIFGKEQDENHRSKRGGKPFWVLMITPEMLCRIF